MSGEEDEAAAIRSQKRHFAGRFRRSRRHRGRSYEEKHSPKARRKGLPVKNVYQGRPSPALRSMRMAGSAMCLQTNEGGVAPTPNAGWKPALQVLHWIRRARPVSGSSLEMQGDEGPIPIPHPRREGLSAEGGGVSRSSQSTAPMRRAMPPIRTWAMASKETWAMMPARGGRLAMPI